MKNNKIIFSISFIIVEKEASTQASITSSTPTSPIRLNQYTDRIENFTQKIPLCEDVRCESIKREK